MTHRRKVMLGSFALGIAFAIVVIVAGDARPVAAGALLGYLLRRLAAVRLEEYAYQRGHDHARGVLLPEPHRKTNGHNGHLTHEEI